MLRFTIIALSAIAFTCCQQPLPQKQVKTIKLHVDGEVSVKPDMASFNVTLSYLHKKAKVSRDSLLAKSDRFKATLSRFGVDPDDVITQAVRQQKTYKWNYHKQVYQGVQSTVIHSVTTKNLEQLGQLYAVLLDDEFVNPGYQTFSHSNLDSLSDLAYRQAVKVANNRVGEILQELEEDDFELLRIGDWDLPQMLYENSNENKLIKKEALFMAEANEDKANAPAELAVYTGEIRVRRPLVVEYKLY